MDGCPFHCPWTTAGLPYPSCGVAAAVTVTVTVMTVVVVPTTLVKTVVMGMVAVMVAAVVNIDCSAGTVFRQRAVTVVQLTVTRTLVKTATACAVRCLVAVAALVRRATLHWSVPLSRTRQVSAVTSLIVTLTATSTSTLRPLSCQRRCHNSKGTSTVAHCPPASATMTTTGTADSGAHTGNSPGDVVLVVTDASSSKSNTGNHGEAV